jgi:hypothetical protein
MIDKKFRLNDLTVEKMKKTWILKRMKKTR